MSKMCKLNGERTSHKGFCIHEKIMMGMIAVVGAGLVGHFLLRLF